MHTSYAYIVVVCIPLLSSCIHTLVLRLVLLASILYAYSVLVFHTSCTEFLCACHNVMSKLSDTVRYLGRVSCHLSPVTCHLSPVTCHPTRKQEPRNQSVCTTASISAIAGAPTDYETTSSVGYPTRPPQNLLLEELSS